MIQVTAPPTKLSPPSALVRQISDEHAPSDGSGGNGGESSVAQLTCVGEELDSMRRTNDGLQQSPDWLA